MRKAIYKVLSAAALMLAAAVPMTSQAAVSVCRIPNSNVNAFVIGLGGQSGNCGLNGGWDSGPLLPDNLLPEITPPDFIFPAPELPGPNLPEDTIPNQPDGMPEAPDNQTPGQPGQGGQGESQDAYTDAVVKLVNAERAKAGLSPLTVNKSVAEAAQIRAQEIKGIFSHTRPDGSSFSTALNQTGASYRGAGENIAYGQNTPEAVMNGWMNSSGHKANILNKDFTSIGVGHYKDANGTDYWTQLFTY